jgi:8-oxo-dGTP pyrophosphatase MutT (NUDIX family)
MGAEPCAGPGGAQASAAMSGKDGSEGGVAARDAASLIVLERRGEAASVLMGMRAAGHRFMPSRLVFPGGAVERGDFSAPAARGLAPATQAMLEKGAEPPLARALAMAAARELAEETGLSLGSPPALDGLFYLCRAITPPAAPIRFHARFLIVAAERLAGALGGSGELEGLRFYRLGDELGRSSGLGLPWITARVLEELAAWLALPEAGRCGVRPSALFRNRGREEE